MSEFEVEVVEQDVETPKAKLAKAVRTTPAADDFDARLEAVRDAAKGQFPHGIEVAQDAVGVKEKGWGDKSKAAHAETVAALQKAWGVEDEAFWGPKTDGAYAASRAKNHGR